MFTPTLVECWSWILSAHTSFVCSSSTELGICWSPNLAVCRVSALWTNCKSRSLWWSLWSKSQGGNSDSGFALSPHSSSVCLVSLSGCLPSLQLLLAFNPNQQQWGKRWSSQMLRTWASQIVLPMTTRRTWSQEVWRRRRAERLWRSPPLRLCWNRAAGTRYDIWLFNFSNVRSARTDMLLWETRPSRD